MISDQNVVGSIPSEVISSAGLSLANDFSINGFSFDKTLKLPIWYYLAGLFLEVVFTGYHNGGLYSGPPKGATTCVSVIVTAIGVMLQNGTRGNASHVKPQVQLAHEWKYCEFKRDFGNRAATNVLASSSVIWRHELRFPFHINRNFMRVYYSFFFSPLICQHYMNKVQLTA